MEVVVISSVPLLRSRSLDQPGPLARPGLATPGRRSSCGRASRRVTGGSSLRRAQRPPSGLRRRCRRLPCSEGFLLGARRASPVPAQPFAACCRPYPAGTDRGQPAFLRDRCCLRPYSMGSASGTCRSRGLHDVRCLRPAASLPSLYAGLVRRYRPVLSPLRSVSSASRLPGRCRVETFTRWVAPPFFWSRRVRRRARRSRTRTRTGQVPPRGSAAHSAKHRYDARQEFLARLGAVRGACSK